MSNRFRIFKIMVLAVTIFCASKTVAADILQADIIAGGGTFTIINPGTYFFAENLNGTITIDTNNVTLDFVGFTLTSTHNVGIFVPSALENITIIGNGGSIVQSRIGSGIGINMPNGPVNIEIRDVTIGGWNVGINGGSNIGLQALVLRNIIADGGLSIPNNRNVILNKSFNIDIRDCIFNSNASGVSLVISNSDIIYIADTTFNNLPNGGTGCSLIAATNAEIINCTSFNGFNGDGGPTSIGFNLVNSSNAVTIKDCFATAGDTGFNIVSSNDIVLSNCKATDNNTGFIFTDCKRILVEDCQAFANGTNGFELSLTSTIILKRCLTEFNLAIGFKVDQDSVSGIFQECVAVQNEFSGFDVFSAKSAMVFESNVAKANGFSSANNPDSNYTYNGGTPQVFISPGPGPAPFFQLARSATPREYWDNLTL